MDDLDGHPFGPRVADGEMVQGPLRLGAPVAVSGNLDAPIESSRSRMAGMVSRAASLMERDSTAGVGPRPMRLGTSDRPDGLMARARP